MEFVPLVDGYGRRARDLRVSLTDRCNLRCSYCMPAEGLNWLPTDQILTDDEVLRLIRVAVTRLGVERIRFTGGEPLLRKGLERIIAGASDIGAVVGGVDLALTTNGLGLDRRVHGLVRAGLRRVNVSLDSLDPVRYARITRRDRLPDVLRGIEAAAAAGLNPVKVNSVIVREQNMQDVIPLAEFCLRRGYQLRFIEQMPLGPEGQWQRDRMVTADEILALLAGRFVLTPVQEPRGGAPAQLWAVRPNSAQPGGVVGVIASVTRPFCGDCDRTRLTSDGQVRSCLFSRRELDLRAIMRGGGSDDDIVAAWSSEHGAKPRAHGIDEADFIPPARTMSSIGG